LSNAFCIRNPTRARLNRRNRESYNNDDGVVCGKVQGKKQGKTDELLGNWNWNLERCSQGKPDKKKSKHRRQYTETLNIQTANQNSWEKWVEIGKRNIDISKIPYDTNWSPLPFLNLYGI